MKQLFHLCSTWQRHHWKKVYQATALCSVSLSSFSSLSLARQAALATIRAEWLSHGEEKCTVVEWKEITKGINSMSSLPPWKNVYKSGRWPDPNNNLLRACLPRHNAFQSKVQLSNMATSILNPFFFFFHPNTFSQHSSAVNHMTLVLFLLTLFLFNYHWHEIGMLFHIISEARLARIVCNARRAVFHSKKETSTFWKMWHLFWHDHAGMKVKMKTYLSSALYWQKGSTVEAVIIFKEQPLNTRSSFFL